MGYAALNAYALPGSAISVDAMKLNRAVKAVIRSAEDSQALFGAKAAALSQLHGLAADASESNWDSFGASEVNSLALYNAASFVRAMPDNIPMPEFSIEPDGSVSLDWISSRYLMCSLSISATDRLAFAWLDGTDSGHAVVRFDQRSVPKKVLEGILDTLSHESTAVRVT